MAFTDASPASQAILNTIYALASLHQANTEQAYQYKHKAIGAVWASAAKDNGTKDTLQRIVATNYLAVFEVSQVLLKLRAFTNVVERRWRIQR
jgi:hypothetical protein